MAAAFLKQSRHIVEVGELGGGVLVVAVAAGKEKPRATCFLAETE